MRKPLALSLALLSIGGSWLVPGTAQPEDYDRDSYLIFQLDNDLFTGEDRDYTNGARLAFLRPISVDSMNKAQTWLRNLGGTGDSGAFRFLSAAIDPDEVQYDWGIGLTQLMYTPPDPELTYSPPGERPYAGWLGMEFSMHAKDRDAVSSVIFSVGTTGKYAYAEETQKWVHTHISGSPIFQGWDSQIPGELTLNLNYDQKRRFGFLSEISRDLWIDLDGYFEYGAGIGNFRTDAYVGTLLRSGFNLPLYYMTPRIQLGNYSHELFRPQPGSSPLAHWSLYVFGGARGTAVAHDITIDGPIFRDFDTGISSEPLVGELLFGIGARYRSFTLTFSRTFRSKEFKEQNASHQFGSVLVSLGF